MMIKMDILSFSDFDIVNFELDVSWSRRWSWTEAETRIKNTTVTASGEAVAAILENHAACRDHCRGDIVSKCCIR